MRNYVTQRRTHNWLPWDRYLCHALNTFVISYHSWHSIALNNNMDSKMCLDYFSACRTMPLNFDWRDIITSSKSNAIEKQISFIYPNLGGLIEWRKFANFTELHEFVCDLENCHSFLAILEVHFPNEPSENVNLTYNNRSGYNFEYTPAPKSCGVVGLQKLFGIQPESGL